MKEVLRSLISTSIQESVLIFENYKFLNKKNFQNLKRVEELIIDYLLDFYINNSACPSYDTLHNQALSWDPQSIVYVEELKFEKVYYDADFKTLLHREQERQRRFYIQNHLKAAAEKLKTDQSENVLSYLHTAINLEKVDDTGTPVDFNKAGDFLINELEKRRYDNLNNENILKTGYPILDDHIGNFKKGQLYLHAGFIGHMKSTFMINVILNMCVDQGQNTLLFTSEMPAKEVMFMLVCIHSANDKFFSNFKDYEPLDSFVLLHGHHDSSEEDKFRIIYEDLVTNQDYGRIRIYDPSDFSTWGNVKAMAIQAHLKDPIDVLWVDYLTRLKIENTSRGFDEVQSRNEMIVDAKRFALNFNNGEGLLVCSPFQINRKGYLDAKSSHGVMNPTVLAQYNASEKEADIITYIFFDDIEAGSNLPKVGFLKNRWGKKSFEVGEIMIDPLSRKLFSIVTASNGGVILPGGNILQVSNDDNKIDDQIEIVDSNGENLGSTNFPSLDEELSI